MRTLHVVAAVALVCLAQGSTIRTKRQTAPNSVECGPGETQIVTDTIRINDPNMRECPLSLISRYYQPFIDACAHWMGSVPDHIASSNAFYCIEDPTTDEIVIKATVCCKGIAPATSCVQGTCTDPDNCDYAIGAVQSCPSGQTCQAEYSCPVGGGSIATITKSCKQTCPTESCSGKVYLGYGDTCGSCCSGAFCNQGSDYTLACHNDLSECSCPNFVPGNYHCDQNKRCVCNNGCSGDRCQTCTVTCDPNPCGENGACSLVGGGVSCCCHPGYGGDRCQHELSSCSRSRCSDHGNCYQESDGSVTCVCDPGYSGPNCQPIQLPFRCPSPKQIYFTHPSPAVSTCTNALSQQLSLTSELSACKYYMRDQYATHLFEQGKDGDVSELTGNTYNYCNSGQCGRSHVQVKTCCPSCFSNPCQNGGYCSQKEQPREGEDDFYCRCKFGFTGKYCQERVATCFAFGEPHYITFDGKKLTFQGVCRYVLTSYTAPTPVLSTFQVIVKNEHRGGDLTVSYPQYIEIQLAGYIVRIGRNRNVDIKPPGGSWVRVSGNVNYPVAGFSVVNDAGFKRLETTFGLVVAYDGYNMMYVQAPYFYQGLTGGICNNMDGVADNDLVDCNGVSQADTPQGHTQYGDSCSADTDCTETNVPGPCDETPFRANDWCGHIINPAGPFASCINNALPNIFESCTYDVCRNQDNKCPALESLVTSCREKIGGAPNIDWRTVTGCPMNCSSNSRYNPQGSACQPTCDTPDAARSCRFSVKEVCECITGYILLDGECVPQDQCGCRDEDFVRHAVGSVWGVDEAACTHLICRSSGDIDVDTARPVHGGLSEWGEWSPCGGSTVNQQRSRDCTAPVPSCGGQGCVGDTQETRACPTSTTSTTSTTTTPSPTPTPPPCLANYDFNRECGKCNRTRNPRMYLANPCDPCDYFQCIPTRTPKRYTVKHRQCSACTCWNQAILTCDHDPAKLNPRSHLCKDTPPAQENKVVVGSRCTTTGSSYTMVRELVPGDNTKYYWITGQNKITMPCGPGTVFDLTKCDCVHGYNPNADNEMFCMKFENQDRIAEATKGVWLDADQVTLARPGVEGPGSSAASFNGAANIEIPIFKNMEIRSLTISFWYKGGSTTGMAQALVANDDCEDKKSSLQIFRESATGVSAGILDRLTDMQFAYAPQNSDGRWHHIVMTISMTGADLYVDGEHKQHMSHTGPIQGRHCPLRLGSKYNSHFYHGLMDQVCFFKHTMSASDVTQLYQQYASTANGVNGN